MIKKLLPLLLLNLIIYFPSSAQIPLGYYTAATGLQCGALKDALNIIITNNHTALSYSTIDNIQMPIVDVIPNDANNASIIWDIYSNNNFGPEPFEYNSGQVTPGGFCGGTTPSVEGICWNKEHTFPRSWFKLGGSSYQQPTEADLFLVRPTDSKLNGRRGNIAYSTVSSPTFTFSAPGGMILDKIGPSSASGISTASSFEPNNAVKGDIARGYFYIITRYQGNLANWYSLNQATTDVDLVVDGITGGGTYPSLQLPYLTLLYNWHLLDPVDAKEINRNDLIYSQQNNRNPFIDHPEYVAAVFQCTGVVPVTLLDFTAQKNNESALLKWFATYETSFKQYDVERSTDGSVFNKIGEVAGQNLANYSFPDNELPKAAVIYYRLKMIDLDGKFRLSKIVSVKGDHYTSNAIVYPNPTLGDLHIRLSEALRSNSSLQVTDVSGRVVKQQLVNANTVIIDVDVKTLPSGRYFVRILNDTQLINQSFVVIK